MQTTNTTPKTTFLKEWTPAQFKAIEKAIFKYFNKLGQIVTETHGTLRTVYSYVGISNFLGLAYTSTSDYAAYWVCNVGAICEEYPQYQYIGFAIGVNGGYYAVIQDKEEKEIILPLLTLATSKNR